MVRRRGIGRFLIAQLIRTIHEQDFRLIEVQCAEQDEAALGLFRGLGFVQVDTGRTFRKELTTAAAT